MKFLRLLLLGITFLLQDMTTRASDLIPDSLILDNGKAHELLQAHFPNIPSTCFIFTINTAIGSNSNANVIHVTYNNLLEFTACKQVYFVSNDAGGLNPRTLERYFNEILDIPFDRWKDKILIHNGLFDSLMQGSDGLSRVLYIYRNNLVYSRPCKLANLKQTYRFPYDVVQIKYADKIQLRDDQILQSTLNYFYPLQQNMLQIADIDNTVRIVDPTSGETIRVLSMDSVDEVGLYNEFIARNKKDKIFARNMAPFMKAKNRKTMPLYVADVTPDNIYIASGIQVFTRLRKSFRYIDDEGNSQVIEKGDTVANLFLCILKCDWSLNIQDIYYFDQKHLPKGVKPLFEPNPSYSFTIRNDTLYCYNDPVPGHDPKWSGHSFFNKGVSRFLLKNRVYRFNGVTAAPMVPGFSKNYYEIYQVHFPVWNNKQFLVYDISPNLYDINQPQPAGQLTGSGEVDMEEQYKQFIEDPTTSLVNWRIFTVGAIAREQYLFFFYEHAGQPLIEIKDKLLHTLQVVKVDNLPGIKKIADPEYDWANVCLTPNNQMHALIYEDEKFFIYRYEIISID